MVDFTGAKSRLEIQCTSHTLPHVYLFPPEEDEQKSFRIFPPTADPFASHGSNASGDNSCEFAGSLPYDGDKFQQYPTPSMRSYTNLYQEPRSPRAVKKALHNHVNTRGNQTHISCMRHECERITEERFISPPSRRSFVFEERDSIAAGPESSEKLDPTSESPFLPSMLESPVRLSASFKKKIVNVFGSLRKSSLKDAKANQLSHTERIHQPTVEADARCLVEPRKEKSKRKLQFASQSAGMTPGTPVESSPASLGISGISDVSESIETTNGKHSTPLSRRRSITQMFSRKHSSKSNTPNELCDSISTSTFGFPSLLGSSRKSPSVDVRISEPVSKYRQEFDEDVEDLDLGDDSSVQSSDQKSVILQMEKTADLSNRFSLHVDNSTDSPIMEFAVKLNSLDLSQFDSGVYAGTNDDTNE